MMQSKIIPQTANNKLNKIFNSHTSLKAKNVYENARISVSFSKVRPERFIISGIVSAPDPFQVKVQGKVESDGEESGITSHCTCRNWHEDGHCEHVGALFLHFQMSKINEKQIGQVEDIKSHISFHGQSVHVDTYGRIERSASKLMGANANSTYSSLQYLLTSRKTVHFPLPEKLTGKLQIDLVPTKDYEEFDDYPGYKGKFFPIFSYTDENNIQHKKISLFENLYLFDWQNGKAFNLTGDLSHLIKSLIHLNIAEDVNIYLKLLLQTDLDDSLEVSIKGKKIDQIPREAPKMRFSINSAKRKGFLNFNIELFDSQDRLVSPPTLFKVFTTDGGYLNSFRTKSDSYEFIKALIHSITYENQDYKKIIYSASARSKINEWLDYLLQMDEIVFYDDHNEALYELRSDMLQEVLTSFFNCFSETAARFSFFLKEDRIVQYQIPKSFVFNGISNFYKEVAKYNYAIFYNNIEVKTWSSNIRFERQKSNLDWFEVNLVLDEKDYQIIKNADINEEFILSQEGLVLLNSKEKELLKFMKKYTKHEAQKGENTNSDETKRFTLNFRRSRIFELFELKKHGIEGALTAEEEKICENLLNMKEMPKYDVPEVFNDIPRDYQLTGYQWLRFLFENKFGACLADDMGLGKTLQTIMFLESIIERVEKILIVCPVSILLNWQNEIDKFSNFDVEIYYGEGRSLSNNKKVILTSYGVMKKESYTTFKEIDFDILIMDEVQHLKNIRSQGATAARNLRAQFRVCLTGTPVENDLSEFYNILDLSIPGIWGDLSLFKNSSSKKSRLLARQTVRPFILRRTKEQVLKELPEKVENHIFLSFSEEEKNHYLATLGQIRKRMEQVQQGRKYSEILKSLLQLRQLCLWQSQQSFMSTKIEFLLENLEQLLDEGHKVLVFSQFTTYLDHIQNKIRERSWKFARIDGSQNMKKRQAEVDRFQNGDAQVFLISLKAGGVGLNLTAASYIFLMDPWWNPAVESQAIDRAYRIGQENKLTVYRPIIKDSVEEKVLVLQNAKQELFKDLMSSDDENFYSGKLSLTDFQQLIS